MCMSSRWSSAAAAASFSMRSLFLYLSGTVDATCFGSNSTKLAMCASSVCATKGVPRGGGRAELSTARSLCHSESATDATTARLGPDVVEGREGLGPCR